ncbi:MULTISPECIES: mechanosensitive ion channel domain-containing protein [Thalassospira]|jgi:potassium-dependent mechanosensitive channel|nr:MULTISPECIES: DUF3772 domain-containing protein [Thalassospira]OCK07268.1 MscS Mechanosensitive ion channel [Thalassospira sp. KO164]PXX33393.1 small-conductance mechanosensitive channel [Thalassospira sp. 11-3]SEE02438.1 Small-conductance mechanosensitive channel [Thalassospira permensis]
MTTVRPIVVWIMATIMSAILISGGAYAQDKTQENPQKIELDQSQKLISGWNDGLDDIDAALSDGEVSGRLLNESRAQVEKITEGSATLQSSAAERLNRLNAALGKLGEPPAEGQSEVPAVAAERSRLNDAIAEISGVIKQVELVDFRATEVSDHLARISRERFTRRILGRVDVPWDGETWGQVWSGAIELPDMVRSRYADLDLEGQIGDELAEVAPGLVLLAFIVMAALIGGEVAVLRWLPERWQHVPKEDRVSLISGTRFLFTAMVPGIALVIAYQIVNRQPDLLAGSMGDFIYQCFAALLFLLFVGAAIRSIYSPFLPGMRRAGTTATGARVVGLLSLLAAVIYASDLVLLQGATTLGTSLEIALVQSVSNVFLISVILFVCSLGVFWEHGEPDRHELWAKVERRSRRGLRIVAVLLPVLTLLGYVALARFILENLMTGLAFITSYWLLRGYARALVHTYLVKPSSPDDDGASDAVHGTLYFWLRVTIDVVMFSVAVPLAVLIFTDIAWADLLDAAEKAFIGIQVGGINFSLRAILIAILLFLAVLGVMRFFQRMLNTRVLPNTKLDEGLQHSVSAIFGYAGICLAVLLAISAAGMDLSNLAIIAGAISVGIGFGMQSIVSNFVSGLILLIERPIKVGDWIVVGADQGLVKDIRVRATEIETFDRSSVVIPNSELISNRVMNWTLKDRSGRGIIRIGVSYGSDANKVREILLEIADKRREILSYPAPQVVFMDFGASSLDFELRYFLRDIGDVLSVGSAVRFEILERFRAEGVEIPFPQQDVHFRDIDRLADAIRDAGRGNAKPVIEAKDEVPEANAETGDGEGTDPATPPSTAKDENRDRDAAARSIPDAGGDADGDGPR